MNTDSSLGLRDKKVIWHPYTQHQGTMPPIPIVRAAGAELFDESGNSYLDAISSWWVNLHGHAHPYIAARIAEQAATLEHVIFTGFTHEPAVSLAERILPLLPGKMARCFYSDNGSTAVEVALKMAIQYWRNKNRPEKKKIIAFRNAYHGDTFGAMSVSGRGLFTDAFREFLFEVTVIDTPQPENLEKLEELFRDGSSETAGFIYEPLLQAAGGMLLHDAKALSRLIHTARENDILCIADEVLTGFGRTGSMFAGDQMDNKPDIITLSKGLTGGTLALGLTACTEDIFEAFLSADRSHTFFHGHSYTANPIACVAGLASLDLLQKETCTRAVQVISEKNESFVRSVSGDDRFLNPRSIGSILAFETGNRVGDYRNQVGPLIMQAAMKEGIYLRPLGNTVYIMPPYCITDRQLETCYEFLRRVPDITSNA